MVRGVHSADQFDDDVGVGGEHRPVSPDQLTSAGTKSTRLRSTLRLKTWVRRSGEWAGWSQRMRATALPTVPNPRIATLSAGA